MKNNRLYIFESIIGPAGTAGFQAVLAGFADVFASMSLSRPLFEPRIAT